MIRRVSGHYGASVLIAGGLTRALEERDDKRPLISDIPVLAQPFLQVSHKVILVHRPAVYSVEPPIGFKGDWRSLAVLRIVKNQSGKMGDVEVCFEGEYGLFS